MLVLIALMLEELETELWVHPVAFDRMLRRRASWRLEG
jgi:hypothetical protein